MKLLQFFNNLNLITKKNEIAYITTNALNCLGYLNYLVFGSAIILINKRLRL